MLGGINKKSDQKRMNVIANVKCEFGGNTTRWIRDART